MPIFEYLCRCGRKFETLVLGQEAHPVCPRCGASEAERLHSRFAAVGSSKSAGDEFGGSDGDFGGDDFGGDDDDAGGPGGSDFGGDEGEDVIGAGDDGLDDGGGFD